MLLRASFHCSAKTCHLQIRYQDINKFDVGCLLAGAAFTLHSQPWILHSFITRFSSSSSKRWQSRQGKDRFALMAKVQGLKSRAAFKLLEINDKYGIFQTGQTVIDLGYAPGSWSQVALDRTSPNSRVVGIDIIPAQPPKGVSTIQGNFLSAAVQDEVKRFLRDLNRVEPIIEEGTFDYIKSENSSIHQPVLSRRENTGIDEHRERVVDVVLSDMSAPWEQTDGFWKRSLSDPYFRMMNTSGMNFRDHAGSMDLCDAALQFASDTLRPGGHFVCKFYQGNEDKAFEVRLKSLFTKVYREKPESSRNESREAYFVALRKKSVDEAL